MDFREPLLTAADEIALARAVEAGALAGACLAGDPDAPCLDASAAELSWLVVAGERARERLLLANCRLVMSIAHPYARRLGLNVDDLFQEGFLGLAEAVDRFDHARGLRFSTFAGTRIRSRVLDACRTRCGEVDATQWAVRSRGIAALIAVPLVTQERELPLPDPSATAAMTAVEEADVAVSPLLDLLPDDERAVVEVRYGGDEPSVAETALRLGVSATTVRRLEARALRRLRAQLEPAAA